MTATPQNPIWSGGQKVTYTLVALVFLLFSFSNCLIQLEALIEEDSAKPIIRHWQQSNLLFFGCFCLLILTTLLRVWRYGALKYRPQIYLLAQVFMSSPVIVLNLELLLWVLQNTESVVTMWLLSFLIFGGISVLSIPILYVCEKSTTVWIRWLGRGLFLIHTIWVFSLSALFEAIFVLFGY